VVHRRPDPAFSVTACSVGTLAELTMPAGPASPSMPSNPAVARTHWSTGKLGLVVSAIAVAVAVVLDRATTVPNHVIVLAVMIVAFAASCHLTAHRR
jgi:hypothetical protein